MDGWMGIGPRKTDRIPIGKLNIQPLWHLRDRGILFDRNSLNGLIKSLKSRGIRCRLDLCYIFQFPTYFQAEIAIAL